MAVALLALEPHARFYLAVHQLDVDDDTRRDLSGLYWRLRRIERRLAVVDHQVAEFVAATAPPPRRRRKPRLPANDPHVRLARAIVGDPQRVRG